MTNDRESAPLAIDEAARAVLAALADQLIPAADGMPSASQAGVAGRWLDEVLRSRPDLGDDLRRLIDENAGRDPAQAIADLPD